MNRQNDAPPMRGMFGEMTGGWARCGVLALVCFIGFQAADAISGGTYRGPSAQVPPTQRNPILCSGQADADLVLSLAGGVPGEELGLVIGGDPGARFTLFADTGEGPVFIDGVGTFCLDFGPGLRTIFDGLENGEPRIDADGLFAWTVTIPDKPHLRGRTFYLQALLETDDGPDGYAITNQVEFSILP